MPYYVTRKTLSKMKKRLKHLINVEKPAIIKEIAEASSHGDLSENAEYDAAKARQELLSRELFELTQKLDGSSLIEELKIPGDRVTLGTKVVVRNQSDQQRSEYTILGPDDSDAENSIISYLSPIAKCLIGKLPGDTCQIETPAGSLELEVLEVSKAF